MGIRAVPPKQAKKILTNRQTPLTAELGAERERESRTSYSPLALVASRRKLGRASRSFVPPKSHPHSRKSTAKRNATKQIAKKKSLKNGFPTESLAAATDFWSGEGEVRFDTGLEPRLLEASPLRIDEEEVRSSFQKLSPPPQFPARPHSRKPPQNHPKNQETRWSERHGTDSEAGRGRTIRAQGDRAGRRGLSP
jgi:hypothetical protein